MPRRRRHEPDGLNLPRHLRPDAVFPDPIAWRARRFEWSGQHAWPEGMAGYLEFFRETRDTYRQALGLPTRQETPHFRTQRIGSPS